MRKQSALSPIETHCTKAIDLFKAQIVKEKRLDRTKSISERFGEHHMDSNALSREPVVKFPAGHIVDSFFPPHSPSLTLFYF